MPLVDYQDEKTGEIEEVLIRTSNIPETIISEKTGNICRGSSADPRRSSSRGQVSTPQTTNKLTRFNKNTILL